jgi:hypothetical protein
MVLKIFVGVGFKGIVSWDFVVCLLVSFNVSDVYTHVERVCLLLKIWFCDKFLFLTKIESNCAKLFQIVLSCIKIVSKWVELSQFEFIWVKLSLFESNWVYLSQIEFIWVKLSLFESNWDILSHIESFWVILSHDESYWVNMSKIE